MALSIKVKVAGNMKGVPNHAQHTELLEPGLAKSQTITYPSRQVVSQLPQQQQHILSMERFFVALGDAQALLGPFDGRFDSSTTEVIGIDSRPDGGDRGGKSSFALLGQPVKLVIIQIESQDGGMPLS